MKKKILAALLTVFMLTGLFSGCSGSRSLVNSGKIKIVTTIFPEYDWVRELLGENTGNAELTMLLDNGVDLHSFQPTAADILKISVCDLFIYIGGESDTWVNDALKEAINKDMAVINLMEVLGGAVKTEEVVDGMQTSHSHGEDKDGGGDHDEEADEHVWLSLKNAVIICGAIGGKLSEIDPGNADKYQANLDAYNKRLNDLDSEYKAAVDSAEQKTLLFADRFPFRYLTDDYGIGYYAAFPGCSAETEASFKTISGLAKKVDELELTCVLTLDGSNQKIAETVVSNTKTKNQRILSLDSMQSTTIKDGETYLSVMERNLEVLKEALN